MTMKYNTTLNKQLSTSSNIDSINSLVDLNNLPKAHPDWVVGFVDAEGCFFVNLIRKNNSKSGYRIEPSFFIKQAKESASALFVIKEFFGKGSIRWDDSAHKYLRYEIRNLDIINSVIIPFFDQNPLLTSKRLNYLDLKNVVELLLNKEHLTETGLNKIRSIKEGMNTGRTVQAKLDFMNSIMGQIQITPGWLSGFIDGEGYFGVYVSTSPRKRCELRLSIGQNAHDVVILEAIAKYLGVTTKIVDNTGKTSTGVKRLDIYKLETLKSKVIPIFDQYPLLTNKLQDYKKWKTVLEKKLIEGHSPRGDNPPTGDQQIID